MATSTIAVQSVFQHLWSDYTAFNPGAKKIYDLLLSREQKQNSSVRELLNDHIALRTLNHSKVNVTTLGKIFEKYGYRAKGEYNFTEKKLFARHFEHGDERMPKVFISELEVEKLSPLVRKTAEEMVASVSTDDVKADAFLWSRRPWKASHQTYLRLLEESEYAAWMYAFGYRANHFTIAFNQLQTFTDLKQLNQFICDNGFALNTSGGEIKGTPEVFLEQSSTLAEKTKVDFEDGTFEIPSCYYEFARRYIMPNGQYYQGFVASSADKIFESTNVRK